MKYLFIIILLIANILLSAQSWEQLLMHGGGYVTGIIPHPTDANTLFARIDVAGVYKTTDGGDNWNAITNTIPKSNYYNYYCRSFVIDNPNTQNLYFISGNAPYESGNITDEWFLWISNDAGNNWTKIICPFAIGGNGEYRYAGETMIKHPTNPDILYISGQPTYDWNSSDWKSNSGLYQYQISTNTWTKLDNGSLSKAWTTTLKINPDNNDIIYLSATENNQFGIGSSGVGLWKYEISTGNLTQVYNNEVFEFDFDANGADSIVIVEPNGINWTFDGGTSWNGLIQPFGYSYNYFITCHPSNSGQWFFGYWDNFNSNGLIETTDFGTNFYESKYNAGSNASNVSHPTYANDNYQPNFGNATATLCFHPVNPNHIYISDWYGVFKSEDGNQNLITNSTASNTENSNWNWSWKTKGIYNLVQLRVTKHPTINDKFYNCVADIGFYEGNTNLNTVDYQTIHPITSIYKVNYTTDNQSIGYMIGKHHSNKGRILKTIDSGTNWFEVNSNFIWGTSYFEANNSNAVTDIQLANGTGDTLVVGIDKGNMSNQIYLSTDGGNNYTSWETGISTNNIFKSWTSLNKLLLDADGKTFYVWHQANLYKRNIADAQWTLMTNPTGTGWFSQVIADPTNSNTLFATQYGNLIYKSIDNGATWSTITTIASRCMELAVSENGTIAVIDGFEPNTGKAQTLIVSEDNGTSWNTVNMSNHPTMVSGILFLNNFKLIGWSKNTGAAVIDLSPVLPVDLLSFDIKCQGDKVTIDWSTVNEINLDNFEMLSRTNHTDWQKIKIINAEGNQTDITDYQYSTRVNNNETIYYQLKMNDFDGQYKLSEVISIDCQIDSDVHIYPNPSINQITIEHNKDLEIIDYQIINNTGQVIKSGITSSNHDFRIDISAINNGVYFIKSKTLSMNQKLIITNK